MELQTQPNENGGSSLKLKKYVPTMNIPQWTGSNLENPETLVVSSTYDGAFTCVMGTYLLEQGRSPCGRPIYNKPGQPLFIAAQMTGSVERVIGEHNRIFWQGHDGLLQGGGI